MAATRLVNALEIGEDRATVDELRVDLEFGAFAGDDFVFPDVSLLFEDLGDVRLDFGIRCGEFLVAGTCGVFETGEEVGNGICENCPDNCFPLDSCGLCGGGFSFFSLFEVAERHAEFAEEFAAFVIRVG